MTKGEQTMFNAHAYDNQAEKRRCENCRHRLDDYKWPIYAVIAGSRVRVAQCGCEEDGKGAPVPDVAGAEAFTFTQDSNYCPAFEMEPGVAADKADMAKTYHQLNEDLQRDAWAGSA